MTETQIFMTYMTHHHCGGWSCTESQFTCFYILRMGTSNWIVKTQFKLQKLIFLGTFACRRQHVLYYWTLFLKLTLTIDWIYWMAPNCNAEEMLCASKWQHLDFHWYIRSCIHSMKLTPGTSQMRVLFKQPQVFLIIYHIGLTFNKKCKLIQRCAS